MRGNNGSAFVRWQATAIAQLGYANSLILGLSAGGLAFSASLLVGRALPLSAGPVLLSLAAGALILSILAGLSCAMVRLYDFRITSQISRKRGRDSELGEFIDLRSVAASLGTWTWSLLWVQAASFGLGAIFLTLAVGVDILCNVSTSK